ncbi:uncharacterized protein LOC127565213 [Drosophila albomicans]|uniref:Uncharacterized protein LOC127565213 n=1 Tax=Drosophila albomicans TaxID=7291 RepID=A0A9C6W8C0_DROAB|nr:uncharacterized protein LOC127565213 [Drosophila albomicans]
MVCFVRNLLGLTILAVLTSTGYAIHCYNFITSYNSSFDKMVFPNKPTENCTFMATGCKKQTIGTKNHGIIVRSCYYGKVNKKKGCEEPPTAENQLACDVCTKDGCNGSGSLAPIAGAIILYFGVVHLFI